jgi:gamma-carbonic anhydrase
MSRLEKQLERFLMKKPRLGKRVFVARGAVVLGDVTVGDCSSIWFNAVLRGDLNRIVIGHHTNVQDNAVLHLSDDFPCLVGNYVTVGHGATVHACTVEDGSLIGMGATILDGAVIGAQSLVGARALVTEGTKIPPGSLVFGMPARVARPLTATEKSALRRIAMKYVRGAAWYAKHSLESSTPPSPTR